MLVSNEGEGDEDEKEGGEKGYRAFDNGEHPVRGVLGRKEDKEHRERYPDVREAQPRAVNFISHFVGDE